MKPRSDKYLGLGKRGAMSDGKALPFSLRLVPSSPSCLNPKCGKSIERRKSEKEFQLRLYCNRECRTEARHSN